MNAEVGHSLKQITKVTAKEWAWVLQMCVLFPLLSRPLRRHLTYLPVFSSFYFSYMFIEPVGFICSPLYVEDETDLLLLFTSPLDLQVSTYFIRLTSPSQWMYVPLPSVLRP